MGSIPVNSSFTPDSSEKINNLIKQCNSADKKIHTDRYCNNESYSYPTWPIFSQILYHTISADFRLMLNIVFSCTRRSTGSPTTMLTTARWSRKGRVQV